MGVNESKIKDTQLKKVEDFTFTSGELNFSTATLSRYVISKCFAALVDNDK